MDVILADAGIHGFPPQPALDLIGGGNDEFKREPAGQRTRAESGTPAPPNANANASANANANANAMMQYSSSPT